MPSNRLVTPRRRTVPLPLSGATESAAGLCSRVTTAAIARLSMVGRGPRSGPRLEGADYLLGSQELVPLADEVLMLVHDRVPDRDVGHPGLVASAVPDFALLGHDATVRRQHVFGRRLAAVPVVPLGLREVLFGIFGNREV